MFRKLFHKFQLTLLFIIFCASTTLAEVCLSTLISDNMVVQAGESWQISGSENHKRKFKIRFNDDTIPVKVDPVGKWQHELELELDSSKKYRLEIDYTNKVSSGHTFTNLVVGRVWIVSLSPNEGAATSAVDLRQIYKRDLERIRYCTITNVLDLPTKRSNSIEWKQCTLESLQRGDLALLSYRYALTVADSGYVGIIQTYAETPPREAMLRGANRPRPKLHKQLPEETNVTWKKTNEQIATAILAQNSRKVFLKRNGRVDTFPTLSQYSKAHSIFQDNLFATDLPPANVIAFEWAFLYQGVIPSK